MYIIIWLICIKLRGNYINRRHAEKSADEKSAAAAAKKVEMEQDNLLIGHNDDIDMDDEETGYEGDAEDFEEEEE